MIKIFFKSFVFCLLLGALPVHVFADKGTQSSSLLEQAIDLSNQEKYHQSILRFKELIKANPKDAGVHFSLGLVYFAIEQYDNALDEFLITIKLDPDKYMVCYFLGLIYESKLIEEDEVEEQIKIEKKALASWERFIKLALKEGKKEDKKKIRTAKKHIKMLKEGLGKDED